MCQIRCLMKELTVWAAALLGAVLFVVILNLAVDLLRPAPSAPVAPAPAPPPTAQPAPAPEPVAPPAAEVKAEAPAGGLFPPSGPWGEKVFAQCKACHTLSADGKHRAGPNLLGVVGRARASAPGFNYSKAMAASHEAWTEVALDKYLTDPKAAIPGNMMGFKGLAREEDRKAVIDYLKSQGAK